MGDEARTPSSSIKTAKPNATTPCSPVSLVYSCQPAAGPHSNRYAAPGWKGGGGPNMASANGPGAPITARSRAMLTDAPNRPPASPPEGTSSASCSQAPPSLRPYAYTAPCPSRPGAPISAREPCSATDSPNPSPGAGRESVSEAASSQPSPARSNTYAPPRPSLAFGAPTSITSPSTASARPNPSPATTSGAVTTAPSNQPSASGRNT
jgi:hypothetical protein